MTSTPRVLRWCPCTRRQPYPCSNATTGDYCAYCDVVCRHHLPPEAGDPHDKRRRPQTGIEEASHATA
jgi:hypothetical protein